MTSETPSLHVEKSQSKLPAVSRKVQSLINLFWLYFGVILVIVQGFILPPLYVKFITPSLYGAWLATGNVLGWIGMVDPGISRILQQRTAHTFGRGETDTLGSVIGTGLFLGTLFALLPLFVFPFSGSIVGWLVHSKAEHTELTTAFNWALISMSLMIATFQPAAANLGLQRSSASGISYTTASALGIVVTYCMLQGGFGLVSLPVGLSARAVLMLVLNSLWMGDWCRKNLRGKVVINKDELRKYSALSTLTFIERIVTALLTQSDLVITARFISNETAVAYSMTGRAFEPIRLLSERMLPAFLPGLAHLSGEGNRERLQEIVARLIGVVSFVISVGAACVVAMNFAFVQLWVGKEYFFGERMTILFAMLAVCNILFSALAETTFAVGGVGPIEIMRVVEGVVRIVLQVVLFKLYGIIGIPLAGCIGMVLVSGYALPGISAQKLGINRRTQYWIVAENFLRCFVLMICGVITFLVLSQTIRVWTWLRFAGCSVVVGIVFTAIGLAISPGPRRELQILFRKLRGSKQ